MSSSTLSFRALGVRGSGLAGGTGSVVATGAEQNRSNWQADHGPARCLFICRSLKHCQIRGGKFFFVIITIFFVERNPPLSSVEILVSEGRLHLSEVVGQFSSCTDGFIVLLRQ